MSDNELVQDTDTPAAENDNDATSETSKEDGVDLYFDALKKDGKKDSIVEIKKGTVIDQDEHSANYYFPIYNNVTIPEEYGTVKLEEILVKLGDKVKKGMPIARITVEYDKINLEEQNRTLRRLEESYHRFVTKQLKILQDQKKALNKLVNKQAKKIANLEYECAQLDYNIAKNNQERQIHYVKKQIRKSETIKNTTELLAPTDGYIDNVASVEPGNKIDNMTSLVKIADPSVVYFNVEDDDFSYEYNMKVTLTMIPDNETGKSENKRTIKGKVICSNNTIESDGKSAICYIKPDEVVTLDDVLNMKIRATIDVCVMNDVLVVPVDVVVLDDKEVDDYEDYDEDMSNAKETILNTFPRVYELVGDNIVERTFIPGIKNSNLCQILSELEEGSKIVKIQ